MYGETCALGAVVALFSLPGCSLVVAMGTRALSSDVNLKRVACLAYGSQASWPKLCHVRACQAVWRGDHETLHHLHHRCKHPQIQPLGRSKGEMLRDVGNKCSEAYVKYMTEMVNEKSETERHENAKWKAQFYH
eukprot:2670852-Amphidinium_carterae.1